MDYQGGSLTNVLGMLYDPADGKLIYLATFVEQLLRGAACRFEKAEIDVEKVIGCVHRLLEDSKEVFNIVLNAAHKVYDQDNRHQSVHDLFRLSVIRLPQTTGVLPSSNLRGNLATAAVQSWDAKNQPPSPVPQVGWLWMHRCNDPKLGHREVTNNA
ncbi:hypothetical protein EV421DRAFT_1733753 [Armillaria borealis]|uniref:Uncharacterized protein n=1 Tax=Armillaria borealis TaxID=47425 RepID=A0AA39MUZ8_9AGAR|nr:hypothetical protein EV421DRAFT_1733753 [Armillaria borealis]